MADSFGAINTVSPGTLGSFDATDALPVSGHAKHSMPAQAVVMAQLKETYGERVELDSPFSDFEEANVIFEDDRPFFAMGLKSSAVNALSSEISQ
jgi:hypothetical protein